MNCPTCGKATVVLSTREGMRRRRECTSGHRFSTVETVVRPRGAMSPQAVQIHGTPCVLKRGGIN